MPRVQRHGNAAGATTWNATVVPLHPGRNKPRTFAHSHSHEKATVEHLPAVSRRVGLPDEWLRRLPTTSLTAPKSGRIRPQVLYRA